MGTDARFTDEFVRGLPVDGADRLRFEPGSGGFGVRVTPAGAKLFIAQTRTGSGRPRRFPIGRFPEVSGAQGRKMAREALGDLR